MDPASPLRGKAVAITRSRDQAAPLSDRLRSLGARVWECPTFRIEAPESWEPLDRELARIETFDWLVVTSSNGARALLERLPIVGRDARALHRVGIAAIGPATADALAAGGLEADLTADPHTTDGLLAAFHGRGDTRGSRFLLARADIAGRELPEGLEAMGAEVVDVVAYRTVPVRAEDADPVLTAFLEELDADRIDLVTFTSPSTARNFRDLVGADRFDALRGRLRAASIGPVTTQALREMGIEPVCEADPSSVPGLVDAIVRSLSV
jgi:uroporphyrinogen III methyltransferase/synthase